MTEKNKRTGAVDGKTWISRREIQVLESTEGMILASVRPKGVERGGAGFHGSLRSIIKRLS